MLFLTAIRIYATQRRQFEMNGFIVLTKQKREKQKLLATNEITRIENLHIYFFFVVEKCAHWINQHLFVGWNLSESESLLLLPVINEVVERRHPQPKWMENKVGQKVESKMKLHLRIASKSFEKYIRWMVCCCAANWESRNQDVRNICPIECCTTHSE